VNMLLNLIFYLNGMAHVGLALATSLAAFLNAGLLLRGLHAEGVFKFQPGWFVFLLRLLMANAAMAFFLIRFAADWQLWSGFSMTDKISQLGILVVCGILIYAAVLFAAGLRWKHIYR
jgi:putative peptidoglycan lipid II flippase